MASGKPESLKLVAERPRPEVVFALRRLPGTRRLIFGGSDFLVRDLDLDRTQAEPGVLGRHESYVTGIALAGGGRWAVSGGYDGRLIWWDLEADSRVRALDAHRKWVRRVVATPDGATIASVADDMVCRVWDVESGRLLHELRGHDERTPHQFPSMLFACAISPDGAHLATGDKVGHVVVWDLASGRSLATLDAPTLYTWDPVQRRHSIGGIRSLAFAPGGDLLAVGGIGKIGNIDHLEGPARVEVFDWRRGERTHELASDKLKGLVEHLSFHPAGDWLLAAGGANDGFALFLDLKAKNIILQEKMPMHVHGVVLDEGSGGFVAAGHGKIAAYRIVS